MSGHAAKRALAGIGISLAIAATAIAIPLVFIDSSEIADGLKAALRIEVAPELSGGETLASFADPLGDDAGPGKYEYPLGSGIERGELDLTSYAIRKPLARPAWSGGGAYWQLELRFAKAAANGLAGGGFRAPAIHVYIDLDGPASGSTESAFGEGELMRFAPEHPWDYVVSADGWSPSAAIRSADGSYAATVEANWNLSLRRLTLRIGLAKAPRLLQSALSGRPSWHYVLVGAYDGAREGHFAAVREYANLHDGGGASGDSSPRIFDLLAPAGISQAAELSSEDEGAGILALVEPVEAAANSAGEKKSEDRSALEASSKAEEEREAADREKRIASLPPASSEDEKLVADLFALGLEERAYKAANAKLGQAPGDAVALAYRGAIVAKRALATASLSEKMNIVAAAYRDLDAAVAASSALDPRSLVSVLLCRAHVSSAVPNEVFERAAQGAADFDAARKLAEGLGDAATASSCLEQSALAFEKAGRDEDAKARWATLAGEDALGPKIRLELAERGY
jgi:Membrane-anchored protein predicted to be involved in regulation of amylopullulanase